MSTPQVHLLSGGKRYGGWSAVRITRSIEAMCGSFSLDVFDRWATQQNPWPLREGDNCSVQVGDETVITGTIDARELGFGGGASATVTGRDATRNVVDCACDLTVWEFANVDVLAFAKKLCAPYGVPVSLQAGLSLARIAVPKKLSIDPGDTAGTAIENVCRVAGLLPVSDGHGGLVLTRAGAGRCTSSLEEGVNLISGRAHYDRTQRHHKVVVLGTKAGTESDWGTHLLSIRGSATDDNIEASRVTYVRPEGSVGTAQAKARAQWEVAVRAARGDTFSVTVQGWQQADGSLWPLNHLVHLRSPKLEVDTDLLICGVTLSLSVEGGSTTVLDLKRAAAFTPMPTIPVSASSGRYAELKGGV